MASVLFRRLLFLSQVIFIQIIFFSCWQSPGKISSGDYLLASRSVDSLLRCADSLSPASLQARLAAFPQNVQDSFFIKRLLVLESLENDAAIKTTLSVFKKVRPGALLPISLEHFYEGIFYQYAGKFDSADLRYNLATKGFEQIGANYFLAQALDKYSGSLTTQGHTDEAISMKYRAIALLTALGETGSRMSVQTHLANVFNLKSDFNQAIDLLKEPTAFYELKKDSFNLAYILAMKGTAYFAKQDFQNALLLHKQALAMRQKTKSVSGIPESLFHVGRSLLKMNQWQEALDTLRVAEKLLQTASDKQGQAYIESGIGEALFNLGRFEEADHYLTKGFDLSVKRKQFPAANLAALRLSRVRKAQNRFAEALKYHEQFAAYRDSVFNQEKYKLSREFTIKYETREKELQIEALLKQKKIAEQRNWWIGGAVFLLSVLCFYVFRMRTVSERQQLEAKNARVEQEANLMAQQLEIQKVELEANRARLTDYAQMLVERNQQLYALTHQIELGHVTVNFKQPEDTEALFNQVILTEADWEKFQEYFNKVYPGFIPRLRTQHSDLTPAEIRLILLDKMGLNLKETSAILGISLDGVKKGRYRLKKKYGIEGEDLSGSLQPIGTGEL